MKAIIFDFCGVVVSSPYRAWLRDHGLERTGELARVSEEVDIGLIGMDQFYLTLSHYTGQAADETHREFEAAIKINQSIVELVKQLKARGIRVGLLSNSGRGWARHVLAQNDLESLFDQVTISAEVGFRKPQTEIFSLALGRLNVRPSQAVFVDDTPANVDAARAAGIAGILFENTSDLRRRLASHLQH